VSSIATITAALERARLTYWEQPGAALEVAVRAQEQARLTGEDALQSRALVLQGAVCLHTGDLAGAFALAAAAEPLAGDDIPAHAELAALNTHLHFFSGSYAESLSWAFEAVERADTTGDRRLRLHARRMACLAFGNVGVDDLERRFLEVLELARELGSPWEQAVAHNDLAHLCMTREAFADADAHLDTGEALVAGTQPSHFLRGILHATRSQLRMTEGRPDAALEQARLAVHEVVAAGHDANPYMLGMAVLTEVEALLALDRLEEARDAGERALEQLGDRVPQAGSMILTAVAGALRAAGRAEAAYDTLARAAELEREALREFARLQVGMERARLETEAARREADLLREQADRDWLTGVRNRRYLARAGERVAPGQVSLAALDLDHFKAVNDRYGHQVGDQVLVRVAQLLVEQLRAEDVVVRTGGEEFAVLMPRASIEEAAACCERLRTVIAAEPWDAVAPGLSVTASFGVATAPSSEEMPALERTADERLYAAKRAGRNRVVHAVEPIAAQ
jgi:diguanylate cyclase (GGDEF)-like protein